MELKQFDALQMCLQQTKRRKTAIIAVARHLLMRCWAMLRDHKAWKYKSPDNVLGG